MRGGAALSPALLALLKRDSNSANGLATAFGTDALAQAFALYQSQLSQQFNAGIGATQNINIVWFRRLGGRLLSIMWTDR